MSPVLGVPSPSSYRSSTVPVGEVTAGSTRVRFDGPAPSSKTLLAGASHDRVETERPPIEQALGQQALHQVEVAFGSADPQPHRFGLRKCTA